MPRSCAQQFDLDPSARIKTLSQGQRARAGCWRRWRSGRSFWSSTSRRPGLDPIVRRGDPLGDHPHDRPGGPHGPLLVALARRGRARVRPRRADRPRPDRAARLARDDQGAAPPADAAVRRAAGAAAGSLRLDALGRLRPRVDGRLPGLDRRDPRREPPASVRRSSRTRAPRSKTSSSPTQHGARRPAWRALDR